MILTQCSFRLVQAELHFHCYKSVIQNLRNTSLENAIVFPVFNYTFSHFTF